MLFVANLFHVMLFCVNCVPPHNPAQIFVWQNMNRVGTGYTGANTSTPPTPLGRQLSNTLTYSTSSFSSSPNSSWQAAIKLSDPSQTILHSFQWRMKIFPQILSEQKSQEISQRCIRNPGWGLRGNPPGFGGDSPGWTIWHQVAGLAANFVFSSPHHSLSSLLDRYILWFAQIYFVI